MRDKLVFNWSGGKDSALCLHKILEEGQFDLLCLLTSINESYQRVSMHGLRVELLEKQAKSIGLPLKKMLMPEMPDMAAYERIMESTLRDLMTQGATGSVFGDIFLEDLRSYREHKLSELDLRGIFPLWKIPSTELVQTFLRLGFKSITTCVSEKYLDKSFAGRVLDESFFRDLPAQVDPCGENGEFHTFVYDGPIFREPIAFEKGELVYRKYLASPKTDPVTEPKPDDAHQLVDPYNYGFWYCDLY